MEDHLRLKGKYAQVSAHWVWEQLGVVNGGPDDLIVRGVQR